MQKEVESKFEAKIDVGAKIKSENEITANTIEEKAREDFGCVNFNGGGGVQLNANKDVDDTILVCSSKFGFVINEEKGGRDWAGERLG